MKKKIVFSVFASSLIPWFSALAFDSCKLMYVDPKGQEIDLEIPLKAETDFKLMSFDLENNLRFVFNALASPPLKGGDPRPGGATPVRYANYSMVLYEGSEILASVSFSRTTPSFYMQFKKSGEIQCGPVTY